MINHARTLLLNQSASANNLATPGAEYIPAEFAPVTIPSWLRTIRQVLFGNRPDRVYLNYRAQQYLTLLHATELLDYLILLDTRLTYDPARSDPVLFIDTFVSAVTQLIGSDRSLTTSGTIAADDSRGASQYSWHVTLTGSESTVIQLQPDYQTTVSTPANDGITVGPIDLSGSNMSAYAAQGTDATWQINEYARPKRSLGQIFDALRSVLTAERQSQLFALPSPPACKNLYAGHFALPYRLAAVILAVIYQTEAIRRG